MTTKTLLIFIFIYLFTALTNSNAETLNLLNEKIETTTFKASRSDINDFKNKIKMSKKAYKESSGEDSQGLLFGSLKQIQNRNKNNKSSPVYLVSQEELAAISYYTESAYLRINRSIRENSANELPLVLTNIKLMISGLNKLPSYQGVSYRGIGWGNKDPDAETISKVTKRYDETHINSLFQDKGFLSTTNDSKAHFLCAPFIYKIYGKSGKDIADFSTRPEEAEVLFRPLTKFLILKKYTNLINHTICKEHSNLATQFVVEMEEL